MKKIFRNTISVSAIALLLINPTKLIAQEKIESSLGVDVVSSYVWRGENLSGFSIQPSISLDYKGFSLSAWGTASLENDSYKELDLSLTYTTGGFSVGVTDYYVEGGPGYFHYQAYNTTHTFEAQIGYDFDVLAINWYTNFAGLDGTNKSGNRAYSSYISLTAPFTLGGLDWCAEIGATPWSTDYYNGGSNGFTVCDISLGASKEIKITDTFTLPAFAKVTVNPKTEGSYFVFGLTF